MSDRIMSGASKRWLFIQRLSRWRMLAMPYTLKDRLFMVMAWFCHHVYTLGSMPPKVLLEAATLALSGTASCSPSIWLVEDPAPAARAASRVSINDSSVLSSFSLTQLRILEDPLFCCSSTPYRMRLAA